MIVNMALYGLKSSGAAFRAKLSGLHADPDVWLRPSVKPDGAEYYEMVLCYVDDVLAISDMPMRIMDGVRSVFKL